jgi:outer membrane protein TolC
VRPQLDLTVGYGLSGVGGTLHNPSTGEIIQEGSWDDALQMLKDADYDQWSTALMLRYPLGNNQAKAQRVQARYQRRSAEQAIAAQRQVVIQEVRRAARALEASGKSIDAAAKARELAERNLDAEQKKFANGMSTNYQVLLIQSDLAVAQATELQSQVAYRKSLLGVNVSTGTLLETTGVKMQDEPDQKEPHTLWKDVGWLKFGHWASVEEEAAAPAQEAEPAKEPAPAEPSKERTQ